MTILDDIRTDQAVMLVAYLLDIGFRQAKAITDEEIKEAKDNTSEMEILTGDFKEWMMKSAREIAQNESEVELYKWIQRKQIFDISPEYELDALLADFNEKLEVAQRARREVEEFLEDNYAIDIYEEADYIEDEDNWCYGFDRSRIDRLIKESEGK